MMMMRNLAKKMISAGKVTSGEFNSLFQVTSSLSSYRGDANMCGLHSLLGERINNNTPERLRELCGIAARKLIRQRLSVDLGPMSQAEKWKLLGLDSLKNSGFKHNMIDFDVIEEVARILRISIVLFSETKDGYSIRKTEINDGYEIAMIKFRGNHFERVMPKPLQPATNQEQPQSQPKLERKLQQKETPKPKPQPKPRPQTPPKPQPRAQIPKETPKPQPRPLPKPRPQTPPKEALKTQPRPLPKPEPKVQTPKQLPKTKMCAAVPIMVKPELKPEPKAQILSQAPMMFNQVPVLPQYRPQFQTLVLPQVKALFQVPILPPRQNNLRWVYTPYDICSVKFVNSI